ncbi:MAG: sugar kinase [Chloroflexi bacterium]|nr:sugar kinase [Chloroflexota bacterium]
MIVALGDLMLDIVVRSSAFVLYGTDCTVQASISPGGSAANFAVWAARLGAEVGLIAKVGDDLFGRALLHDLEREKVMSGVAVGKETTGFTLMILHQIGKRTMLAARGANATLSTNELDWALLDRAHWLHLTAYSFFEEKPREASLAAIQYVKERGKPISLDPSSTGYLQHIGPAAFFALTQGVDVLFPNLEEGSALTGESEPERILHALLQHFPMVVLKMGADGAIAGNRDEIAYQPGFAVPVVDTTGAGDAFAAAFVVTWLAQHDLAVALREGNHIAAGVVQAVGARSTAALPVP